MNSTLFTRPRNAAGALAILAAALFLGWGCDKTEAPTIDEATPDAAQTAQENPKAAAPDAAAPASPAVVTSGELPERPERIVSLAPNVTEILFALDAGERVVGVTRFCDYPDEAAEIPKIGGIVETDLEAILARRPDLVVGVTSGADPKVADKLDEAELPYAFIRMDNLAETYAGIEQIGEWVDRQQRAAELVGEMQAEIERLSKAARTADESPRVLMLYGRKPLVAAGPNTFGHELVELAGGRNVMADADTSYPKLDIEKVLSLDPQVIIDASMAAGGEDDDFWSDYDSIDAVENGRVHRLRDPVVLRPAPRLVEGLERICKAVAPTDTDE